MLNKFVNFNINYKHDTLYSILMFSNTVKTQEIEQNIIQYYKSCLSDQMKMIEFITLRNQFIKGAFFL